MSSFSFQRTVLTLAAVLVWVATSLAQQNTVIRSSAIDGGFGERSQGNTMLRAILGQGFAGVTHAGNSVVTGGFFADGRLRGTVVSVEPAQEIPATFLLEQNYPNPFNPTTTIKFALPKISNVRLSIYDMLGREVSVPVNDRREAGVHEVTYGAVGLASGVYFYRLHAGDFVRMRKMILLK